MHMAQSHAAALESSMSPRFLALGGVWLDEIKKDGRTSHEDVLGGSVTYGELVQY